MWSNSGETALPGDYPTCLPESGPPLIVWKLACIKGVNPVEISTGLFYFSFIVFLYGATKGVARERDGWARERSQRWAADKRSSNVTDRWQRRGTTLSLHEFPHVCLSHLVSTLSLSPRLSSPLQNFHLSAAVAAAAAIIVWGKDIYLARVPQSRDVAGVWKWPEGGQRMLLWLPVMRKWLCSSLRSEEMKLQKWLPAKSKKNK